MKRDPCICAFGLSLRLFLSVGCSIEGIYLLSSHLNPKPHSLHRTLKNPFLVRANSRSVTPISPFHLLSYRFWTKTRQSHQGDNSLPTASCYYLFFLFFTFLLNYHLRLRCWPLSRAKIFLKRVGNSNNWVICECFFAFVCVRAPAVHSFVVMFSKEAKCHLFI